MNKAELISLIAEKSGLTKKDSEQALNAVVSSVTETLSKGDKVQLVGFGTFEVKQTKARPGRNPQTGQTIQIPASKRVVFKVGKELKESVK